MKRNKHIDHVASCLCCTHLWIVDKVPGYSEYTPGVPASIGCRQNQFKDLDFYYLEQQMRILHDQGQTCPKFDGK